jgi:hypothetical protein
MIGMQCTSSSSEGAHSETFGHVLVLDRWRVQIGHKNLGHGVYDTSDSLGWNEATRAIFFPRDKYTDRGKTPRHNLR